MRPDRDLLNPTVLVNEPMVEKGFGGLDPIGKRIEVSLGGPERWATVVGVIRSFQHYRFPEPMGPACTCRMPSRQTDRCPSWFVRVGIRPL